MGRVLGTTIDMAAARRDAVLAGGFSALVAGAALQSVVGAVLGLVGGAFLGVVLHVLPPEPVPGDQRRGRIVVRAVTGAIGGWGVGGAAHWLVTEQHGAIDAGIVGASALGAVAGLAWYSLWGAWETRSRS